MAAARIYHPGTCLPVHYKHISSTLLVCLPCEADPLLYVASLLRIPPAYLWLLLFSSLSPPCSAKPVWGMMAVSRFRRAGRVPGTSVPPLLLLTAPPFQHGESHHSLFGQAALHCRLVTTMGPERVSAWCTATLFKEKTWLHPWSPRIGVYTKANPNLAVRNVDRSAPPQPHDA